jgi:hypothetical protein
MALKEEYTVPVKKFDGKWFKAAKWTQVGNEGVAKRWAEAYRKDGYLVRVVRGSIVFPRIATQYPHGLGGESVKRKVWVPGAAIIVYIRRK